MKKITIVALLMVMAINAKTQSHLETFIFCNKSFAIQCDPQDDGSILTAIKEANSIKDSFKTWTTNEDIFAKNFLIHFLDKSGIDSDCKIDTMPILKYAEKLIRNYISRLQNDAPVAGVLHISKNIDVSMCYNRDTTFVYCSGEDSYKKGEKSTYSGQGKVLRFKAEINDGFLENILVYVFFADRELVFTLPYPAGISTQSNFKNFADKELYYYSNSPYWEKNPISWTIRLDSLIRYDQVFANKRRDYSPKDTVLDLIGGTSIALHKEETKKLLEAQIFTDFEGLNAEKPNGLVQAEISKRIGINSVQRLPSRFLHPILGSWGAFQYIAPVASINKVEANNKYLVLSDLDILKETLDKKDASKFDTNYHRYSNILSLYQHQWISAGADLNLLYFNNHDLKYEIYLNIGGRFGLTAVSDSLTRINTDGKLATTGLVNNYSVSTVQFYPEARINFLPEERISFSLSQKIIYFKILSPTIQQVTFKKSNPNAIMPISSGRLGVSELLMTIRTNPNSRLFGRVRFNWELGNSKNNFSQFQVGYSTYILGYK